MQTDPTVQDRLFSGKTQMTLSDGLAVIKTPGLQEVAEKLQEFLTPGLATIPISLVDTDYLPNVRNNKTVTDLYSPIDANEKKQDPYIQVAKNGLFNRGNGETVLLHEILHALTYQALKQNTAAVYNLHTLVDYASITMSPYWYGTSNTDEFISALFTDGDLLVR